MEKVNSYLGIAENDYLFAKYGMDLCRELGNFNSVTAGCAQAAEKYLKAVIDIAFPEDEDAVRLLKTHNLRSILNKIKEKYYTELSSKDCKWLGDFYFDARYPGDNFILSTEEDALEAIRIVDEIKEEVLKIMASERSRRNGEKEKLNGMKAF